MQDEMWKEAIEKFFKEFCFFFFPDFAHNIDFEKGYEFLNDELLKLVPESADTKRYIDKLAKIRFKNGTEQWIMCHVEVQGYKDSTFEERMFIYFYRIFDNYKKKIVALAIFSDDKKDYKPQEYSYDFLKTTLSYKYRTYKILDADEKELEKNENPFAMVVLAVKSALMAKKNQDKRLKFKIKLARLLFSRGYSKRDIQLLLTFIDFTLKLSDRGRQKLFFEEIKKLKGDDVMPLIGDLHEVLIREAEEKARNIGMEKGIITSIKKLLSKGFSNDKIIELLEVDKEMIDKAGKNT